MDEQRASSPARIDEWRVLSDCRVRGAVGYRAIECIMTQVRMRRVAQHKRANWDERPRFDPCSIVLTVFGGCEESSGKSRPSWSGHLSLVQGQIDGDDSEHYTLAAVHGGRVLDGMVGALARPLDGNRIAPHPDEMTSAVLLAAVVLS